MPTAGKPAGREIKFIQPANSASPRLRGYFLPLEQLNNPGFNSIESDGFKNQAGANSFSLLPLLHKKHSGHKKAKLLPRLYFLFPA